MSLSTTAVERLFKRLILTYGQDFDRRIVGTSKLGDVKGHWAFELAAYNTPHGLEQIAFALENLPEHVPNVVQFKNLCRQAPKSQLYVALPPPPPADPKRIAEEMAKLGHIRGQVTEAAKGMSESVARDWAYRLRARIGEGYRPTMAQRAMMCAVLPPEPAHASE